MTEPTSPEEQELARIWPERFVVAPVFEGCGHPLTPENRYLVSKRGEKIWVCAECVSAANKRYYQRRKLGLVGPVLVPPPVFKKQCTARDANSGLRCGLLEHGPKQMHSTPRGLFTTALAPGQASPRALELAYRATAGSGL